MTFCSSYGSTKLTLVFSGSPIGDALHRVNTQRRLATPVTPRHNTWSTTVVHDGSYPALTWEHSIQVYNEEADRIAFADWFWQLADQYKNTPYPLELRSPSDEVVVAFGDCHLAEDTMDQPDGLFLTKAGLIQLVFYGTVIPSVN